jgi:hypothetical protein
VLSGSELGAFSSTAAGRVVAFCWQTGWVQVPVQVDERKLVTFEQVYGGHNISSLLVLDANFSTLAYADPETHTGPDPDPRLDADDELVFMASEAGVHAPFPTPLPNGVVPGTGLELALQDPLDGGLAYVYLFETDGTLLQAPGPPAVVYRFVLESGLPYKTSYKHTQGPNPEDSTITTAAYELHFDDRWIRDRLRVVAAPSTGSNLLDRHKYSVAPGACYPTEITASQGPGAFLSNIDGPVRAIRAYLGVNSGVLTQRDHFFYAQREDMFHHLRVHSIGAGGADLFDYDPSALGMYYSNDLNPTPVLIDGQPETLIPGVIQWELVQGPHGSLLMSHEFSSSMPITVSSYYSDDFNPGMATCTGDGVDFGTSGPWVVTPMPNTDPRFPPFDALTHRRTIYYETPGKTGMDAALRAQQAATPLVVSVADFPLDPQIASYCTAKANSCGSLTTIGSTGFPTVIATSGFVVTGSQVPGAKPGMLLYTDNGAAAVPFSGGILCLKTPLRRALTGVATGTSGQCNGTFAFDMNAFASGALGGKPMPYLTVPGTRIHVQWWGRDVKAVGTFLSDGLTYLVNP